MNEQNLEIRCWTRRKRGMRAETCLQGHSTTTVLTNTSKYITVVTDDRQKGEQTRATQSSGDGTSRVTHAKGSRPMHATTLTFERQPVDSSATTTSKSAYSGQKDGSFTSRPPRCQSLHLSQFHIGSEERANEQNKDTSSSNADMSRVSHEYRDRWQREMKGSKMIDSLTYKDQNNNDNHTAINADDTSPRSTTQNPGNPFPESRQERYDIVTGESARDLPRDDFRKISGNRILQCIRGKTTDDILG